MESKKIEVGGRTYVLYKIPAFKAQNFAFYCLGALKSKNLSDIPEDVLVKLCSYISVINSNGAEVKLEGEEMISINVKDAGVLMTLELNLLEYNFGFFFDGSLLKEFEKIFKRMKPEEDPKDISPVRTSIP